MVIPVPVCPHGAFLGDGFRIRQGQGDFSVLLNPHGEQDFQRIHGLTDVPAAGPGKAIVALVSLFGGKKGHSKLLYALTTGNYNKKTEQKTMVDWICHDEEVCRKYMADPWCSFIFSNSGYGELLQLVDRCNRPDWYAAIPKELPVWLFAGDEDAVGNNGKGVTEVYEGLKAQGLRDVTITLYRGARHEVHNEPLKEQLFHDIIDYLDAHMPK